MAILPNQEATLTQGTETLLHTARFTRTRLTLTGVSGEFTTIPFRVKKRGFQDSGLFQASEVELRLLEAVPSASIFATTPAGVGSLDIVFEVRTREDALGRRTPP